MRISRYFSEGFGFMALLLAPPVYVIPIRIFRAMYGADRLAVDPLPGAIGLLLAAGFVFKLSRIRDKPGSRYKDRETGKMKVREPMRNTLFLMPLEYIAAILVLGALAMLYFKTGSPG